MDLSASSSSVSVLSPRKSIFRRPIRSISFMPHWVVISSRAPLYSGANSVIGFGAITTPAAWTDAWRVIPSSRRATSSRSLTRGSPASRSLSGWLLDERLVERHVERRRDQLRDLVHVGVGDVHGPSDVAHDGPGLHRAERDDLGDVLAAVLARDVLDDLAPAAFAEVDVDVGQRDALGVQEPLEDQVEVQRIDVGDVEAVGHDAARRRPAARADGDALLARVADEIPDDQEVPRVLHLLDHRDLVRHALLGTPRGCAGAARRPASASSRGRRRANPSHTIRSK